MTFLAVYHHDNLLNPVKLLTHREDIAAVLGRASIVYRRAVLAPELLAEQEDGALRSALQDLYAEESAHVDIERLAAIPSYAHADPGADATEYRCAGAGLRLLLQGRGVFCLNIDQHLFALGCVPGDEVSVPAGAGHWFRQGAGSACVIARLAKHGDGLESVASGNGLAGEVQLPEI